MRVTKILATAGMAALLALQPVATTQAFAVGLPMFQQGIEGRRAMDQLRQRILSSLAKNPAGNASIEGGSCGYTPRQFYDDVRDQHPEIGLSKKPTPQDLKNFVAYLGTLELVQLAEDGNYENSRRLQTAEACSSDLKWTKLLQKGLWVWRDRNTHEVILKGNCGNILKLIRKLLALNCVYASFGAEDARESVAHYRTYVRYDDECFGYREVATHDEADGPNAKWLKPPVGCIGRPCILTRTDNIVGKEGKRTGTIPVEAGKIYQVRMSPGEKLALCLEFNPRPGVRESSYTPVIRWNKDYVLTSGVYRARVYYDSGDMPQGVKRNDPQGLFFWASSAEEERQINQEFATLGQ